MNSNLAKWIHDWNNRIIVRKKRLWKWIGFGLTAAAFIYIVSLAISSWDELRQVNLEQFGTPAVVAFFLYLISLVVQFIVWARLISCYRLISWQDFSIYFRSILIRRIPGGIWHVLGRTSLYSGLTNLPRRIPGLGSLLEWLTLFLVGLCLLIGFETGILLALRVVLIILIVGIALIITIAWQPSSRSLRQRAIEGWTWIFLYFVSWILGILIFYQFVSTVGIEVGTEPELLRIWITAASIGVFMMLIPASFGIQEISLVLLLQALIPKSSAIAIAILIRMVYLLADAMWGLLGWRLGEIMMRNK